MWMFNRKKQEAQSVPKILHESLRGKNYGEWGMVIAVPSCNVGDIKPLRLTPREMRVAASCLRMAAAASDNLDFLVDWLICAAEWQEKHDFENP
jgi:hypothetical protein